MSKRDLMDACKNMSYHQLTDFLNKGWNDSMWPSVIQEDWYAVVLDELYVKFFAELESCA